MESSLDAAPTEKDGRELKGIYVPHNVMEGLRNGELTPREALVVAVVDLRTNGDAGECYETSVEEIAESLNMDVSSVRKLLGRLRRNRKWLRQKKSSGWRILLRLRQSRAEEGGGLLIPHPVYGLLSGGVPGITARHLFMLAYIASFQRNKRCCFAGDAAIGRVLGLSTRTIKNLLSDARRAGVVRVKGRGGRRQLLIPICEPHSIPFDAQDTEFEDLELGNSWAKTRE